MRYQVLTIAGIFFATTIPQNSSANCAALFQINRHEAPRAVAPISKTATEVAPRADESRSMGDRIRSAIIWTGMKLGIVNAALKLRYRQEVRGFDDIQEDGRGILFLSNHPTWGIDALLNFALLNKKFKPTFVVDSGQMDGPWMKALARHMDFIVIPNGIAGEARNQEIQRINAEIAQGLQNGKHYVLYPSGKVYREGRERLNGTSGAHSILANAPDARVALIQHWGLWGSSFSFGATGSYPKPSEIKSNAIKTLIKNLFFFSPKRDVTTTLAEPDDLPRGADKLTLNKYLEDFFNRDPKTGENSMEPNLYVPYVRMKEGSKPREMEQRVENEGEIEFRDASQVSQATRDAFAEFFSKSLKKGEVPEDRARLFEEIGIDSLESVEVILWIEQMRGRGVNDAVAQKIKTVADVLLMADNKLDFDAEINIRAPKQTWFENEESPLKPASFRDYKNRMLDAPFSEPLPAEATHTLKNFLRNARLYPDRVIFADQISGELTYREVVAKVIAMLPVVKQMKGDRIGILLAPSVAQNLAYLAVRFAGKTPVFVNPSAGEAPAVRSVRNQKVETILCANALIQVATQRKLAAAKTLAEENGEPVPETVEPFFTDFLKIGPNGEPAGKLVMMDEMESIVRSEAKLRGGVPSLLVPKSQLVYRWALWKLYRSATNPESSIIFTSGSSKDPKGVLLTDRMQTNNLHSVLELVELFEGDRILAFVPGFHSLGHTATIALPLNLNVPVIYHKNPTEASTIAATARAYKPTVVIGTPNFLRKIAEKADDADLQSIRLVITGAQKCPESLYDLLAEKMPNAQIVEGYGITECSPVLAVNASRGNRPGLPALGPVKGTIGYIPSKISYVVIEKESMGKDPRQWRVAEADEPGFLLVDSESPTVFRGYENYEGKQPFVEFDGRRWFNTEDIVKGRPDVGERHLEFLGRDSRFVKNDEGEGISLEAMEEAIHTHLPKHPQGDMAYAIVWVAKYPGSHGVLFSAHPEAISVDQVNQALHNKAGLGASHRIDRVIQINEIPTLSGGVKANHRLLSERLERMSDN